MSLRSALSRFLPILAALLALAAIAAACESEESGGPASPTDGQPSPQATTTPPPDPQIQLSPQPEPVEPTVNVLGIPDFEDCPSGGGTPCGPWFALKPPDFTLSDEAQSGNTSALLEMREGPEAEDTKVFYLVQEVLPTEFPEVLSGYYKVDNWVRGTPKQYLQFVIIVWGAQNAPQGFPNHQIRYILTGIDQPPFAISNAKFVFVGPAEPVTGEWVPFKVNVKQDFIDLWGDVPQGYERIRLLYEVRYDDKLPESPAEADVRYDNLYFGPAEGSPVP